MSENTWLIIFLLGCLFIAWVLIVFIPAWKKERVQQFDDKNYIGFGRRLFASIIDAFVFGLIGLAISFFLVEPLMEDIVMANLNSMLAFEILLWVLMVGVVAFFIAKYGGTPGKILLKIKIVDTCGNNLSIKNAIVRQTTLVIPTLIYTIGQYLAMLSFGNDSGSVYINFMLIMIVSFTLHAFYLVDCLLIFANKRKRTIHDFLAGSIVIQRNAEVVGNTSDNQV